MQHFAKNAAVCTALAALGITLGISGAAMAAKPAPRPAPAPAAPRETIYVPSRPMPPLWSGDNVTIPAMGPDGVRMTVSRNITIAQRTWNFRSAYNVAALNCRDAKYDEVLIGYRAFIRTHARGLTAANRGVDTAFRVRYGAAFVAPREAYMTQVYNFYSYPPTLPQFCDAALLMSAAAKRVTRAQLTAFAAAELPKLDAVLLNFYNDYEKYRVDAAAWDTKWLPLLNAQPKPAVPAPTPTPTRAPRN